MDMNSARERLEQLTDRRRRRFLHGGGLAAAGLIAGVGMPALAQTTTPAPAPAVPPADVLNFALNLEYLEAEYYLRGTRGLGLPEAAVQGTGNLGMVEGGRKVPFETRELQKVFEEVARDELAHVLFLRQALGQAAVARPMIDLSRSFNAAAQAAGLVPAGGTFDPFANENNFLIGAFIFEDVGVTAYKGAAPLLEDKGLIEAAAGILAVEAYHAGYVRTVAFMRKLFKETRAISDLRDAADGAEDKDQPVIFFQNDSDPNSEYISNIAPVDDNALAFSRTPQEVLNIVYLGAQPGGFFPGGMNGTIR
ncbi:MAG TPA: ferritin-like domain-containing protein [Azospirillaceae bacterium]|nr:ferritin-like domain-containing protein [Azospirillaceae bacterium]